MQKIKINKPSFTILFFLISVAGICLYFHNKRIEQVNSDYLMKINYLKTEISTLTNQISDTKNKIPVIQKQIEDNQILLVNTKILNEKLKLKRIIGYTVKSNINSYTTRNGNRISTRDNTKNYIYYNYK